MQKNTKKSQKNNKKHDFFVFFVNVKANFQIAYIFCSFILYFLLF